MGYHKSTISRELRRNTPQRGRGAKDYNPDRAQMKTQRGHQEKNKYVTFTDEMRRQIVKQLAVEKLSPELITEMGRRGNPDFVSHETIYQWIWAMKHSHKQQDQPYQLLYKDLRHGRRRRKRGNYHDNRGCITNRVSIEKSPVIVEKRKRIGDVEVDLMLGKNHQPGLLVITDRASLRTSLVKISTKASKPIAKSIIRKMKPCEQWLKTMTYDNDLAFASHTMVNEELKTRSFFTHPYTSQEKGTVENRIGVLRRFFPKKTDFTLVSAKRVRQVEKMINERPVRKFNYQTPNAVFLQKLKVTLIT
ncbi:MAG: IS30 family transposase [Cytophagales bacterium]|nr:IS30 family transposase [Cytophagales bacterium]MCE2956755.1 IS30 family transposase [Flammeovirgaceae bacterium]